MSLFKGKLLHHVCCGKCRLHYMIYQRCPLKILEKCFIHMKPGFIPHRTEIRLLSISLNKCGIFSRLASYFMQKEAEINKNADEHTDHHSSANKDSDSKAHNEEKTGSFLLKQKGMSLVNILQINSPYNISAPVNVAVREDSSARNSMKLHKQMKTSTELCLHKYNQDLDIILKKVNLPSAAKGSSQKLQKSNSHCGESKKDIVKAVKYPLIKTKNIIPVKTENYDKTQQFLQSLGIPCEELEYYPLIQEMKRETILTCINKLKELGIHVIFSLFLIDRISYDLKLNNAATTLRKKKTKVPLVSFRPFQAYIELCQLLEKPDLDIRNFLEQLAEKGIYCDLLSLHKKVKKLRELGATANDIWSNLEILQGYNFFDRKVELYKRCQLSGQDPFPVHLFLAKTITSFKEHLAVGSEITTVAELLDVSVANVKACWSFQKHSTTKLQYKVTMCLAAGISKRDIFNNLGALMKLPLEECHSVTTCFRESGLPASVFVLNEMVNAAKFNGNGSHHEHENKCLHEENIDQISTDSCKTQLDEDWIGESKLLYTKDIQIPKNMSSDYYLKNNVLSTKKHRRGIFNLIGHLLQLDRDMIFTMYECSINVSAVEMLDVSKNLDYLISKGYTKNDIAKCPLVLAHPHKDLVRVVSDVNKLIILQLQSAAPVSSSTDSFQSFSCSSSTLSPSVTSADCGISEELMVEQAEELKLQSPYIFRYRLLANPVMVINTFQYFLEKESSFSLASSS